MKMKQIALASPFGFCCSNKQGKMKDSGKDMKRMQLPRLRLCITGNNE